ncbi:MAG: YwiC-like family protein [Chloroflexota bacterium]
MSHSATRQRNRSRLFRKTLLIPAEHGSWSWLLVPYFVGLGVAGQWSWALLPTLLGGLSAFLLRQPATAWLRIRQGRGRRSDQALAAGWTAALLLVGIACLALLLTMGLDTLLWLLPPLGAILVAYLAVAQINRASVRSLWMEIAGAAGLAAMAPAAYLATGAPLDATAWALWLILALHNVLGALYVRQRIADTRKREMSRRLVLSAHLLGVAAITALTVALNMPQLLWLPFLAFLIRAVWAVARPRPIPDIKRFGFTEVGVEIIGGLWIIASFAIQL